MGIETAGGGSAKKEQPVTEERRKLIEEVFKRYHKKLLNWCFFKLKKRYPIVSENDAEDMVEQVYVNLLNENTNPIDLTKPWYVTQKYLDVTLDRIILHHIRMIKAKSRAPEGGFISLEEIADGGVYNEEKFSLEIKQYFDWKEIGDHIMKRAVEMFEEYKLKSKK